MKKSLSYVRIGYLIFLVVFITSCEGQLKVPEENQETSEPPINSITPKDLQIADYVRNILQDKDGHLWFGTNGYGVAHYDGKRVSYYSVNESFHGQQITGMTEDSVHNLWFATDQGVVKYPWAINSNQSKKQFTNFTDPQYFGGQRCWSIHADRKGYIWAGAETGIFRFDGLQWSPFKLPYPEEINGDFITSGTSWCITEDKAGNIWFSTNGYGAFKFDGQSFTQYTQTDGLADNSVDVILEDSKGNMWFGTRFGGISRYDGTSFTNYTEQDSIGNNEVCEIYEDREGNIWLSSEGYGVYRYHGGAFTNYSQEQGLGVRAVQAIYEDREGRLWVGGGGGLYRIDGPTFINVTRNGPWH
ncbi:MAG: hypothetical protein KDC53_00950 [Saprospiraceae bacterium]|nr:hypothetical protein [Saprospiraceae bacterium]